MKTEAIMGLGEFSVAVNLLAQAKCDRINKQGNRLFAARHHDYPESMLNLYWERRVSPEQALAEIEAG